MIGQPNKVELFLKNCNINKQHNINTRIIDKAHNKQSYRSYRNPASNNESKNLGLVSFMVIPIKDTVCSCEKCNNEEIKGACR
mmetsp:Transcript_21360/g.43957  ORF Transcript_21360/g.43957 Transcript_21360/m.43957 type:complete len:83 (+) Transcript_21360:492-740(+)